MARVWIEDRIAFIEGPGVAVVGSDLHGNIADLERLIAITEAEQDAVLVLLGDLLHGPDIGLEVWESDYRHLGAWYTDASDAVFRRWAELASRWPDRFVALMGNHDHAHVGGPTVSKFFDDEAAHAEALLRPGEVAQLRMMIRAMPLLAVTSCGVAMTHGAPPERPFDRALLRDLRLDGYSHIPLFQMYDTGWLGEVLWRRGSSPDGPERFLGHLEAALPAWPCELVVHGHEIAWEGYAIDHPRVLNLSTSFGMAQARKTWLRLDLGARYASAQALRPGVELLPLQG